MTGPVSGKPEHGRIDLPTGLALARQLDGMKRRREIIREQPESKSEKSAAEARLLHERPEQRIKAAETLGRFAYAGSFGPLLDALALEDGQGRQSRDARLAILKALGDIGGEHSTIRSRTGTNR